VKNRSWMSCLKWAGAACLLSQLSQPVTARPAPGGAPAAHSQKKGFGIVAGRDAAWKSKISALKVAWFYGWGLDKPAAVPAGVEFVPMAWGYWGNKDGGFERSLQKARAQPGVRALLGFNEPDGKEQANLGVEGALKAWPFLMKTGLRLGSPAAVHADNDWMQSFMKGAEAQKLRVDFITAHWYGGNDAPGFLGWLARLHAMYGRPLWITEFAPADWQANATRPNRYSPQQMADFMRAVLPRLNQLSYVQRYAWYSSGPKDAALGPSALFNEDGSLSGLGRLYASF